MSVVHEIQSMLVSPANNGPPPPLRLAAGDEKESTKHETRPLSQHAHSVRRVVPFVFCFAADSGRQSSFHKRTVACAGPRRVESPPAMATAHRRLARRLPPTATRGRPADAVLGSAQLEFLLAVDDVVAWFYPMATVFFPGHASKFERVFVSTVLVSQRIWRRFLKRLLAENDVVCASRLSERSTRRFSWKYSIAFRNIFKRSVTIYDVVKVIYIKKHWDHRTSLQFVLSFWKTSLFRLN